MGSGRVGLGWVRLVDVIKMEKGSVEKGRFDGEVHRKRVM